MSDVVNILLVDDQQAKLLSHEVVLEGIGENLLKASSAREAFECLLRNEIAVILIDVCMPELDGFELAAMIRDHPRFQRTAIIFVSAVMNANMDQLRGYQLGAVDFVPVPVVPELLRAKVKVFVDLYRKTRQLERFNAELERRVSERTAELQRLNEQLEQRIEERTREREAALAQLFESQKMDAIGQLTGGMAHDFNNLLMVILGSLRLLEKRLAADARSRQLLENAQQGARRGAALTQRLLAFARRQELTPVAVDLGELVEGMRELLNKALGAEVELSVEIQPDLAPVLVDANQLELALLNLALNSRDAMPDGGRLRIAAQPETRTAGSLPTGEYIRVTVADSGSGMDERTLQRATEPFFTTKAAGKGTGLGLSMIQGLAAQSGGQLQIRSSQGEGTTVELFLPQAPEGTRTRSRPESTGGVTGTVLVVDDDALVLDGIVGLIEDLGHRSVVAHSGKQAMELLATGTRFDAVITDYVMPSMNGLELAQAIRAKYPRLPVILMTGYADKRQQDVEVWISKLSKPCSQQELSSAILAAMAGSRTDKPAGLKRRRQG